MAQPAISFIIVERDLFIGRDLSQGLKEVCPGAETVQVSALSDVAASVFCAIHAGLHPVIVTKAALAEIERHRIPGLIERTGADLVIRLDDHSETALAERGWLSLPSPFTFADLQVLGSVFCEQLPQRRTA